jgi:hypothetical protein
MVRLGTKTVQRCQVSVHIGALQSLVGTEWAVCRTAVMGVARLERIRHAGYNRPAASQWWTLGREQLSAGKNRSEPERSRNKLAS